MANDHYITVTIIHENGSVAFTSKPLPDMEALSVIQKMIHTVKPGDKIELFVPKETEKHALA